MSADVLELVFTGSAVLGTALLLLSSIGGGMHVRVHVPMRLPHLHVPFVHVSRADNATGMPMLLGFLAMFGIGGLFGAVAFGLGPIGRTLVAVLFGTCGHEPTALRDLVGRRARVIVSIGERARGTVVLTYDGAVQTLAATASGPIPRGQDVEILAVQGMGVTVRSIPPP